MKLYARPTRLSCAEPLECRRLLSGHAPATDAAAAAVEVVEVADARADSVSEDDVQLAPSDLPKSVVAALRARYFEAQIVEAAFSTDDGPEYGVSADVDDRRVDLTFTPAGNVIEIGETLTSNQLPQAVLDWVRQGFPGARIEQAAKVTKQGDSSYELVIATAQSQELEATVSLHPVPRASERDMQPPVELFASANVGETPAGAIASAVEPAIAIEAAAAAGAQTAESVHPMPSQTAARQLPDGPVAIARDVRSIRGSIREILTAETPILQGNAGAQTAQAVFSGVAPIARVPEVADALGKVVIADVAALERRLAQTIDLLVERGTEGTVVNRGIVGLATLGIFIAGAHLLRPSRKGAGRGAAGQVILTDAANSSWSWVAGTPRWPQV